MTRVWLVLLSLCGAVSGLAGQREFLRADEIDQVRLAQDPNERMKLYIVFARERLAQARQLVERGKPGSSILIHDLLDDYTSILDAIDLVSDDALERKIAIDKGAKLVSGGEKEMLPILEKIRDDKPKELARYQFLLEQAIESTRDGIESASEDLGQRAAEVQARVKQEKQERESMAANPPDKLEADQKKAACQKPKRKKPTLLKPGEKAAGQQ
jgi:hypothetical protein